MDAIATASPRFVVRQSDAYTSTQGSRYAPGVSSETTGATSLFLGLVTLAPGQRTRAHVHEQHESAHYMLQGEEVELWTGARLEHCEAWARRSAPSKPMRPRAWWHWPPWQPEARAGGPGPHHRLAARVCHGERGARLQRDAARDQRLFGPDPGDLRARGRGACALVDRDDDSAECAGELRGGGGGRWARVEGSCLGLPRIASAVIGIARNSAAVTIFLHSRSFLRRIARWTT
jgi:hypothetical protein